MSRNFLTSKSALSTVTAIFMLLIMISAMALLIAAYANANSSMVKRINFENEHSQEQISITSIGMDKTQKLTNITIHNYGTIDVIIKGIYRKENGLTTFLVDPSTPIHQSTSKTLDIANLELTTQADSLFIAATKRGTKSMGVNEIQINNRDYMEYTNSSGLSIGPLMLTFDSLNWARCDSSGNNIIQWNQTWTIPTGPCSWRLNLTNIDTQNRSLTLNQYSGITVSRVGGPQTTTWYLKSIQQTIGWNQTQTIQYVWDASRSQASVANSNQRGVNNVFLTFFGTYSDGRPYAQTIPFEAITIE